MRLSLNQNSVFEYNYFGATSNSPNNTKLITMINDTKQLSITIF